MLYIVGLPIGNLKDITLRALETLENVDIIACEDTRKTLVLLNHYNIKRKLISYHKFNEKKVSEDIVAFLKEGKSVALVSDSGMPLISDPGQSLVKNLKENNLKWTVIPGASASLSALVLSGLDASQFTFVGFLPEKNTERKTLLKELEFLKTTLIFYVSPHSLKKDITYIYEVFGARQAVLVKEITKIYETVYAFVLGEEIDINEKGEFVLVVESSKVGASKIESTLTLAQQVERLIESDNITENQAIAKVAKNNNLKKQDLYKLIKIK